MIEMVNLRDIRMRVVKLALLVFLVLPVAFLLTAKAQQPTSSQTPTSDDSGPATDNGAIALPKKKPDVAPNPDTKPAPVTADPVAVDTNSANVKSPSGTNNYALRVNTQEVTVDVGVQLEKTRQFVPNLRPENFRVYEDGKLQQITGFQRVKAPITALLLLEFANTNYQFIWDMKNAAAAFAEQLQPKDYVAVMTFDMRTHILSDFTENKSVVYDAINSLMLPNFTDRNLFDALYEALDRMTRVDGKKYVILVASGRNTFSKLTLDKVLAKVKNTPDVTIFSISTGQQARLMSPSVGMSGAMRDLDYMQADNQMQTFARMTGGVYFAPRFTAEMPEIFQSINNTIRNKYELVYRPTNTLTDGTYRKLKVELVDAEGNPLRIQDEKHKPMKYEIIARDGYRAKQQVE
jgi:VWFA-related protein